jgi:FemAB-related protein (PEP-CTERM system-associated)
MTETQTRYAESAYAEISAAQTRMKPFESDLAGEWDRFVFEHPGASFFHLTGWKRVIEKTLGYKARYFYCERDGKIAGIAPLFSISNWMVGRCILSIPLAAYGGIVAEDEEVEQALLDQARQIAVGEGVDYLEVRQREGLLRDGFHANPLYVTFNTPLFRDAEANRKRLPKDTRYMIRKAEKVGLRVQTGFDQIGAFYSLFAQSMQRLGTPVFPIRLFQNLIEEFPKHSHLMLVYSGSQPVAGVLSFFFRDTILPYYAGATDGAPRLAANNFMYWELIKWAGEQGFRWFDFGRSKKGTGSFAFKSQWNMNVEPLNYQVLLVERATVPNFSPLNPKFEIAIRLWQKLPLPVTKWLGPSIVRLFP